MKKSHDRVTIRSMQPDDASSVAQLDVLAFSGYWQDTGRGGSIPARTQENILACLELNPQGCFVAEVEKPVGYIFSRVWGKVGWIGTFGVHPDHHGDGIGKRLLLTTVEQLKQRGCRMIGLETMPDSAYNVGFYTRHGFAPVNPTISLDKMTPKHPGEVSFELVNQKDEPAKLDALGRLSRMTWSLLDLTVEALNARRFGWGETILVGWPEPWAAAVVRTTPKRMAEDEPYCEIRAMVVLPQYRLRFNEVLQAVEAFAASRKLLEIYLHINASHRQALQDALTAGYRVSHTMLRLLLTPQAPGPTGIELCRWAM